ncbi:SEC-C domain-containing protein [Mycobacterium sp. 1274756.6]|uniref:SEC-C domain-containing protein n=1 Tax=Mycobacterium sp. 1274756.6 TaxID=1834076 RepID=UPI0007FF5118|nr:SEC-C domain-containing protein [Mycobacterium sp. 1274756.6]OBJ71043.1 hypothetical protein A5643_08715 [Mycobacterium sp. 1274756.6]
MAPHPDPEKTLAAILTEHGPLSDGQIATQLGQSGVANPEDVIVDLLENYNAPAGQLPDERWVWLPTLLAGRVFTHRLSADEIAHDLLPVTPDLDPVTELCEHDGYQQLTNGSPVQVVLPEFDAALLDQRGVPAELLGSGAGLLLEPRTLATLGVGPGDLVGVRLSVDGLVLEPVTAIAPASAAEALAAVLDAEEPVDFDAAVWTVCAADAALFTAAQPPLSEIAEAHGLARYDDKLAPGGFDFDRWRFERDCLRLARRHGIDSDDAVLLNTLIVVHTQMAALMESADEQGGAEPAGSIEFDSPDVRFGEMLRTAGAALTDPVLAEILVQETTGGARRDVAALGMLAETLEPQVPRSARVAARWLHAAALERLGDTAGSERELQAAESMDPDWPLPLLDLARLASDRGDVEAGLGLLHRAGVGADHPLVDLLQRHRGTPRSDIGRNEPCWCGSGRKYKKCHLGNEQLSLPERASWLYAKAIQQVLTADWRPLRMLAALERYRYDEQFPDDLAEAALADPLVVDALLFEGGALEEFLDCRGYLLPDDERLLAEQWLLTERSLFDVHDVAAGRSVTVRDVRTGDIVEVPERLASRTLRPGQLICARVLPVGDGVRFFGGIEPIALHERDLLVDLLDEGADPVELVAFLSRRFAPPTVLDAFGDPFVVCEARVRFSDLAAACADLDACYQRSDDDPPGWTDFFDGDTQRVRATLSLDEDTLRVETISENRLDGVLAVLRGIDPDMAVLEDTRTPASELVASAGSESPRPAAAEPEDPELAAYMEQMILDYERRWLDESIPALSGLTPRQAAADPTRRDDLIRLLAGFPSGAAAGRGMNADRLREALGLD